jgi:hypothetical protein
MAAPFLHTWYLLAPGTALQARSTRLVATPAADKPDGCESIPDGGE